ncbi:MAG: hypothetical protein ACPGU1_23225, partial [Myxococcota bacterium]
MKHLDTDGPSDAAACNVEGSGTRTLRTLVPTTVLRCLSLKARQRPRPPMCSTLVASVAAALLLPVVATTPVEAACLDEGEPHRVVWSWPTNGLVGVPVNAGVFVATTHRGDGFAQVTLNGQGLSRLGWKGPERWAYDPGPLEPNTEYELVITVSGVESLHRFTTGSATASADLPTVTGYTEYDEAESDLAPCVTNIYDLTCLDVGGYKTFSFEMSGVARGWAVSGTPFGASCDPAAMKWDSDPCFTIVALGPTVGVERSTRFCPSTDAGGEDGSGADAGGEGADADGEGADAGGEGGCNARGSGTPTLPTLLLVTLLLALCLRVRTEPPAQPAPLGLDTDDAGPRPPPSQLN